MIHLAVSQAVLVWRARIIREEIVVKNDSREFP